MRRLFTHFICCSLLISTASAVEKAAPPPQKHYIFIEDAKSATIEPYSQRAGWDKITLSRNSNIVPYFSFNGNIIGHFTTRQFYSNAIISSSKKGNTAVKVGFLSFSSYRTTTGKTYQYGSRVVELANPKYNPNTNIVTYLIRGTKHSKIEDGQLTGVSIVVAAKLSEENANALFILDPVLRMKKLNLNLGKLNFGLSNPTQD